MYRLLGVVHMNPEISTDQWDHSEVRLPVSYAGLVSMHQLTLTCYFLFIVCRRKSMDSEECAPLSYFTILLVLMWLTRRQSSTFVRLSKRAKCIMNSPNSSDQMEWVLTIARSLLGLKIRGRSSSIDLERSSINLILPRCCALYGF